MKIDTNVEVALSNQQFMDCSYITRGRYYYPGCRGGWFSAPLTYIKFRDVMSEDLYPYRARNQRCQHRAINRVHGYRINDYSRLSRDCQVVQDYILSTGVVIVAVYASGWGSYSSGVYNNCPSTSRVNHGVVAVGYDDSMNAFKIQNSWGTRWGDGGYMYLPNDINSNCNLCKYPYVTEA